jgi:hypothetical protein
LSCRGLLILSDQPEIKPKSRGGRVASIGDKALIDDRAASWDRPGAGDGRRRRFGAKPDASLCRSLDVLVDKQQLVTAQHDTAIAEFNVAAAVGRLIAAEFRLPVRLYDMDQYYQEVKDKWIGFAGGLEQ